MDCIQANASVCEGEINEAGELLNFARRREPLLWLTVGLSVYCWGYVCTWEFSGQRVRIMEEVTYIGYLAAYAFTRTQDC